MRYGVISLIIGILAIILEIYFFMFGNHAILTFVALVGGIINLTIIFLILSVIAIVLGVFGVMRDLSNGIAKAGILFGIVGIMVGISIILTVLGISL